MVTQIERLTERVHELHGRVAQQSKLVRKLLKLLQKERKARRDTTDDNV